MTPKTPAQTPMIPTKQQARRIARWLGLPESDIEEPDAVEDLGFRVQVGPEVAFPPAPLQAYHVEDPPELGEEPVERYHLEQDRPPRHGEVPLETDVALGLRDDIHKKKEEKRQGSRERRTRRGTT